MRIFITGATGFVGSAVVRELLGAGHHVVGMARSDAGAAAVTASGAEVHRGDLDDLESLRRGTAGADVVIHTAFVHDFAQPGSGRASFKAACDIDARAIEAMGTALVGSNRQLVVTSGTPGIAGRLAIETDAPPATIPRVSEQTAMQFAERGVRVAVLRLPRCVHAAGGPYGFGSPMIEIATRSGVSAYIGDGAHRWCAVHRLDAARLYGIVVERGLTGAFHAVGEEGIAQRSIAEAIGTRLNVPVVSKSPAEAAEHFGSFAMFAQLDTPASSQLTQQQLGWTPTQSGLIADLGVIKA
ncbi:MAG TPA: SDR family oxidoreductase [Kofleriaceae bacterium]|jgi:nucleoside-diphosphate-sugar epimerase|nr:SDR family oxidoreductase [Kofleriaceae bacterium]